MSDFVDACDLLCLDLPHAERIRAQLPDLAVAERSAAAARGLADPTRFTLAAALFAGDELCVCDLAWVTGQAQNLTSHHLRQLKIGGLVSSRRDGRLVIYALTDRGRRLVAAVTADDESTATTSTATANREPSDV